ncbi:MAG: hypothetical protein KIT84_31400 [Labilithrix sp.]|nr:hypothetical protein [Labilithrix sp.]MCW5815576.1 hypothetical protein [Labilithrix sp.]
MVPAFDPKELAKKIENEANCETSRPPFDPLDYARAAEAFDAEGATETELQVLPEDGNSAIVEPIPPTEPLPPTELVPVTGRLRQCDPDATPPSRVPELQFALEDTAQPDAATEEIGREMYSSYLASDFPEALVLAERVLDREPTHALAQLVADRCRERMKPQGQTLSPSSVVRLKFAALERQSKHIDSRSSFVLGHVDGMTDAATVARLSGLPPPEALDRLHALLDLGVIEVVA